MNNKTAIVIGAGIVGLATSRILAIKGYKVKLFERNEKAVGASIRNFGMIWPIGQPDGILYERAMASRSIWKQICDEAAIWYEETGSLHVAYNDIEWKVLQELNEVYSRRNYALLSPAETILKSKAIKAVNLKGALFSPAEIIVDPREAIFKIPLWLKEKYGVEIYNGKTVTRVSCPSVFAGKEKFEADEIYLCSGADFETLYPEIYAAQPMTKCKLQMMRLASQPDNWRMGPALCGGLSLIHYDSFKVAATLPVLKARYDLEYPDHIQWGIHVMACQNKNGEITVGDSHEYGQTPDPFDRNSINQLILSYLANMATFKDETVVETWNGIYPKLTNGKSEVIIYPENGVTIINGAGGAGMTLSFGLCEEMFGNQRQNFSSTQVGHRQY